MAALPAPSQPTVDAIFRHYETMRRPSAGSYRLGVGSIGIECERALWYSFRWVSQEVFDGKKLRLFETGNREETRMITDLKNAGINVSERNPETGKQHRVSEHGDHFAGFLDGAGVGFKEAPATWHVIETKTHNEKSFKDLVKNGVQKSKPVHFAAVQTYMRLTGMERTFYLAHNKDTDALHSERIPYNGEIALGYSGKAARVIFSPTPLEKISKDPSWYGCRFCVHIGTCHGNTLPPVNCRTCLHSTPEREGGWTCARWKKPLTFDEQAVGCPAHLYLPQLIAGTVTDAGDDFVQYTMRDGSSWRDGTKAIAA